MKKTTDGRRPKWLRSFRYRLVFFSSFTIAVIIAVFAVFVFTLFTLTELKRVDEFISAVSAETREYLEETLKYTPAANKQYSKPAVLHVYDESFSMLYSSPQGSAPALFSPDLFREAMRKGEYVTLDPHRKIFLSKLWWILPWNCLSDRDLWRVSIQRTTISGRAVYLATMVPLDRLLESRHILFMMIALAGLAGIVLSLFVGEIVAGQAMKPLKGINRALSKVSLENMVITPPEGETDREILEIVRHINSMLKSLNQSVENLQQFTADASHELRTPLAIMRGTVDVALLKERECSYYIKKFQEMIYGIEGMQNLVGALLELARLDSIRGIDKKEPSDLLIVSEDAISNVSPIIKKRGQTLKEELQPAPTTGREAMILRLVNNLLENASKHSSPGSSVGIRTYSDLEHGNAVVEIWDNGPGLGPDEIKRCFERFWRAEFSRTTPGFGLGLPLVQRIAQIHGAIVEIESQKGSGTLFRVRFQLDASALEEYNIN